MRRILKLHVLAAHYPGALKYFTIHLNNDDTKYRSTKEEGKSITRCIKDHGLSIDKGFWLNRDDFGNIVITQPDV